LARERQLLGNWNIDQNGGDGREMAESGMTAFEMETVERWCIAAAAPDPSCDERAAPSMR
jgi:hypothetical protein